MSGKKPARLGRGLANLIPDQPVAPPSSAGAPGGVRQVGIDLIERNPDQPRRHFDKDELNALAESIREDGVLTPVLVQPARGGRYRLVAGERRWRAAGIAGLSEIPVLVRAADDEELLVWALAENLLRQDLSAMETADALAVLEERGLSHGAIGKRLGMSRPAVSNLLRLRALEPEFRAMIEAGDLSGGHGRALLAVERLSDRRRLAKEIRDKGLSVRAAEQRAAGLNAATDEARAGNSRQESPQLRAVRQRFENALGAKVRISEGKIGGTVVLHYKDNADLSRILERVEREF